MTSNHGLIAIVVLTVFMAAAAGAQAQTDASAPPDTASVPPLMKFTGTLPDLVGHVVVTFTLHAEQSGGPVLWQERQLVALDAQGRYTVYLGAATPSGLPSGLFVGGEPRWLGIQPDGVPELPRVALVSVPYALKAVDADTIGGRPLSSFVLAGETTGRGADGLTYVNTRLLEQGLAAAGGAPPSGGTADTAGTAGYIGRFTDSVNLGNSVIFQSGTSIGVGTTSPEVAFHAKATSAPGAFIDVYSNTLGALPMVYRAARGTPASPAAVQTDDILGGLAVRGHDGTTFSGGRGQVMFKAAENWTPSAQGTYLSMATVPIGGLGPAAERIRVAPHGWVGIGTATPAANLDVAGNVRLAGRVEVDTANQHPGVLTGARTGALVFGPASGEAIASPRVDGAPNLWGLTFYTSYTPRMAVTHAGLVGIGTATPSAHLEVIGATLATAASFSSQISDGIGVAGTANVGANAWGVYGLSDAGAGVVGRSTSSGGSGGRFENSGGGTALSAAVGGTEVLKADWAGVHAGPGMTPTPVAHGYFDAAAGARISGSSNMTCIWEGSATRYECTIAGESYHYQMYSTIVTPTTAVVATTGSGGGRLFVTFVNLAGGAVKPGGGFAVVVFKQ